MNDLDDLLAGLHRADDILADGAGTHLLDEVLHHRQRHIRLDQGGADFGQRGIDIGLRERAAPAKLVEYAAKAGLKTVEQYKLQKRFRPFFTGRNCKQFRPRGRTCAAWRRSPARGGGPEG